MAVVSGRPEDARRKLPPQCPRRGKPADGFAGDDHSVIDHQSQQDRGETDTHQIERAEHPSADSQRDDKGEPEQQRDHQQLARMPLHE